jgi:thiamine-phosphate pyrophosphorylase
MDANFNRSREALRVMEEFARFVLDDPALTAALKTARHDLVTAVRKLRAIGEHSPPHTTARGEHTELYSNDDVPPSSAPVGPRQVATGEAQRNPWNFDHKNFTAPAGAEDNLVLSRDIAGDVGTSITTPAEAQRADSADVVAAACKRLTESLRCLEEYGKIVDPAFAATIELLRYRAYELERRLVTTLHASEKFASVLLYVLITESLCRGDWFETARDALAGGADCIQLREKNLPDRELLERAKRLAQLCRDQQRIFIVNDRPDIALASGAHGVHLGLDDLPIAAARRMLPAYMIVGVSTHTTEQVEAAIAQAPDYIAVGPMFDTPTKPQPHRAGPQLVTEARRRTALPLVAIGGINESNYRQLSNAPPLCLCVCQAVVADADPCGAARRLAWAAATLNATPPPPRA